MGIHIDAAKCPHVHTLNGERVEKMKFGISYAYWQKDWSCDYVYYAKKAKSLGFDILEVGAADLLVMNDNDLANLKATAKELEIELNANIGPPKQYNVASKDPSVRKNGIEFLTNIMKQMHKLGINDLIGVQYTCWPSDYSDLDKPAVWARGVESVKTLGKTAKELGVIMSLEAVNRFETLVLNTAEEAVRFCQEVDNTNVKILLDTFHMNIEEDNFGDAIRTAGDLLSYMHIGEGNRKVPGQGHLPWAEIGQALRDIGFTGDIVMEPFVLHGGQIGKEIKVFRDLSGGANETKLDADAKTGLDFIKSTFLQ